jgi:hypothetical protein
MGIDGVSPATLVFPLLNFAFGTIRTGFELTSALEETNSLIKSIEQVSVELKSAYKLRDTMSRKVETVDIGRIDAAIKQTEDAIHDVQGMTERARVDISTRYGNIGTRSRILWVVRDSRKVPTELMRLALANACLKNAVDEFRHHNSPSWKTNDDSGGQGNWKTAEDDCHGVAPPPYEQATKESMFERRRFKDQRNALYRSSSVISSTAGPPSPNMATRVEPHISALPATSALSRLNDVRAYVQDYEEMLQSLRPASVAPRSDQVFTTSLENKTDFGPVLQPCYELEANTASTNTSIQSPAYQVQQPKLPMPYNQTATFLKTSDPNLSSHAPSTIPIEHQKAAYPAGTLAEIRPTVPSMPHSSLAGFKSSLRLDGQPSSGSPLNHGGPPSSWRSKNALGAKKSFGLSTSSMEFEARIPGQKKPMQVRWQETDEEDGEVHLSSSRLPGITAASLGGCQVLSGRDASPSVEERHPSDRPGSHVTVNTIVETEPGLAAKPSRRRPARFASNAMATSEPTRVAPSPSTEIPSVTSSRNFAGKRKTRTQWLVEQSTGPSTTL